MGGAVRRLSTHVPPHGLSQASRCSLPVRARSSLQRVVRPVAKRLAVVGDHVSPGLLDLKRIHQFVILAETLNFRRAAERLNMAQPPLSVSIRKLEEELGTKLFMRGAGGVSLTLSGQAILKEARQLLFHGSQLRETAKGVRDGPGGALEVGFVGSATYGLLQKLLPLFCAEYPAVELVLREPTPFGILQHL